MKIQLVAVDMDGTLLSPMGHISEGNADALRRLQEAGGDFVICTGRNYGDARMFVDEVGLRCDFICMSGAAIFDYEGSPLLKIVLTEAQIDEIMEILNKYGMSADLITNVGYFTTASPEAKYNDYYRAMVSQLPDPDNLPPDLDEKARERMHNIHFVKSPREVLDQKIEIFKICSNHLDTDFIIELKKEFLLHPGFDAASSFPTNIEITDITARKGLALKTYAGLKGIPLENVMTIGDSDNDLSMITPEFGYPVAMGNAMDCVKKAARYQTRTNAEDGVAWAIRTLALGEGAGESV